jgi:hypothetical protein
LSLFPIYKKNLGYDTGVSCRDFYIEDVQFEKVDLELESLFAPIKDVGTDATHTKD